MQSGLVPVRGTCPADAEAIAGPFGQFGYPACAGEVRKRFVKPLAA